MEVDMRSVFCVFACVLTLGLAACGDVNEDGITVVFDDELADTLSHNLTEGSPDAVGLLNYLNDEATDFYALDVEARLDKRSARGLIHHRNGPDGLLGTWDDNAFQSIDEVDAVKWVGAKTILRILSHATHLGFVPVADDILGIYDGVHFSVRDADDVLNLVNEVSFEGLDLILNRRAARNIIDQRPLASIEALAKVRYVGRSALTRLKGEATKPSIAQQR
jgi:hypothetical protein